MLRIARLTDYGIVVLAHLARPNGACVHPATDIADATGIPLPTTQKVLKQLARGGLLLSLRGVNGGYKLARAPHAISVAEVVELFEGPLGLTACSTPGHEGCSDEGRCSVSGHWMIITDAVRAALAGVTIAQVSQPVPAPHARSTAAAAATGEGHV